MCLPPPPFSTGLSHHLPHFRKCLFTNASILVPLLSVLYKAARVIISKRKPSHVTYLLNHFQWVSISFSNFILHKSFLMLCSIHSSPGLFLIPPKCHNFLFKCCALGTLNLLPRIFPTQNST